MCIESLLNATCDVYTLTTGQSSMGGVTDSFTKRLMDRPCRVRALRGTERVILGGEKVEATHRIYFAAGTEINATDRIQNIVKFKDGVKQDADTNYYDVQFQDDVDRAGVYVQVDVILREQNASRNTE